jgi:hypothetical protein
LTEAWELGFLPILVFLASPFKKHSTLRQSSSVVEQRTHKPLVGSSNLPFGTIYRGAFDQIGGTFFVHKKSRSVSYGIFENGI